MKASSVVFLVVAALTVACAHGRTLKQGGITFNPPIIGISPAVSPAPTATGPWANYTRKPNTLYVAVTMLNSTMADTDEACATLCNEDLKCEFWTWCPANVTGGCGIPAGNATFSSTVPPGGCITSWDPARNRTALFIASGDAVPFMGGQFDPENAGGGSRKLLQAGSVWGNFTYKENRFYQAIDALATINADSAEECAQACNANKQCFFWTRCPTEAGSAGCEVASFTPNASPQIVPARTCLLTYDGTKNQAAYFQMAGTQVAFEGGYRNLSSTTPTPGPSPTTSPSMPGISPPVFVLPGVSPSPSGNTTLPANATGSLRIRTGWSTGPLGEEVQCYTWNGTDLEVDDSKAYVATGNKKIDEDVYNPYHSGLCGSPDTAGATIAADLLGGGQDALMAFVASTVDSCPATAGGTTVDLFDLFVRVINPRGNQDARSVIEYALAWQRAGNDVGKPSCATIVVLDIATGQVNTTTVAPSTEA